MGRPKKEDQDITTTRSVDYTGLLNLLEANKMTKSDLMLYAGVTPNVVASIGKNEQISMYAAVKICEFFHCDFVEIMAMVHSPVHDAEATYNMILRMKERTGHTNVTVTRTGPYEVIFTDNYDRQNPVISIAFDLRPNYGNIEDYHKPKNTINRILNIFDLIDSQNPKKRS